jgi:hypothetical protein
MCLQALHKFHVNQGQLSVFNQGQLSVFIHLLSLQTCHVIQVQVSVFYVLGSALCIYRLHKNVM